MYLLTYNFDNIIFKAYYTLFEKGGLQRGETVLINAGCTAFAQACVLVASSFGCPVYITLETDLQKVYIQAIAPQVSNIILYKY